MELTYINHACFKLRGKSGTLVTDPFDASTGLTLPAISADLVTVSHQHPDHNAVNKISGTARRQKPFIVSAAGEYEVGGISVFGTPSFHDENKGVERGQNIIFSMLIDDIHICHLGDLGHELTAPQLEELSSVDILLVPVGGFYTIDAKTAVKVIMQIEPGIVIPMHYRTDKHSETYKDVAPLEDFLKEYGSSPTPQPKLNIEKSKIPEETELIVLAPQA